MTKQSLMILAGLAGLVLLSSSRRQGLAQPSGTVRGPATAARPINLQPDLWARLGLNDQLAAALNPGVMQLPDYGRAEILTTDDARLYGAVIPPPANGTETARELWRTAATSIDPTTQQNLALWNPRVTAQAPTFSLAELLGLAPRPAMVPMDLGATTGSSVSGAWSSSSLREVF